MGNISRILAVVTAALSIAFLGFAGVTTFGGPNWGTMAQSLAPTRQDPRGYLFARSVGENPQWTATSSAGETVKTATVLPDVVVAAYDHKIAALKSQLDTLNTEQPQLEQRKAALEAAITEDQQSLASAVAEREQFLESLRQQYSNLSQQVVQKTETGQGTEEVVEARRKDVFRLENQLEVLDADQSRIMQIDQQLVDLIRQIDADLAKVRRRQQQLKSRLGEPYSPEPNTAPEPNTVPEPEPAPEN